MPAGAVSLHSSSSIKMDGNTSFVGNIALDDGGTKPLEMEKYCVAQVQLGCLQYWSITSTNLNNAEFPLV